MNINTESTRPAVSWKTILFMAVALIVGLLAVYRASLGSGFIWDDDIHLTANPSMQGLRGLVDIWTSRSAFYSPLVLTVFWVLRRIIGLDPFGYHLVTILLHAGNAVLLFVLLRRLRIRGAWIAAALFAFHPMQVESVAWISQWKNTQSGFFFLATLLWLESTGWFDTQRFDAASRKKSAYWVALGLFGCALLSKPSTVMLPVVVGAVIWWKHGRLSWRHIDALIPFVILSLLAAGWAVWEQRYSSGAMGFEWDHSFVERLLLAGSIFWFYLAKLAWPVPVMFLYPRWEIGVGDPLRWLALPAILLLAAGLFLLRRRIRRTPFLVMFLYGSLLFPVMGFFDIYFSRYSFVADHFVYLPAIPLFAGAGALLAWLAEGCTANRAGRAAILFVLVAPMLLFCMHVSRRHTHAFHNAETLWRSAIRANPDAWMAHNNLGLMYQDRGQLGRAALHYQRAIEANPDHYEAMCNLGGLFMRKGEYASAASWFRAAAERRPDFALAHTNLGLALEKQGRTEGARTAYETALSHNPRYAEAWIRLAVLEEGEGRVEAAAEAYEKTLAIRGYGANEQAGYLFERAVALQEKQRIRDALAMLGRAVELNPTLPDAYLLRGMLQEDLSRYTGAENSYRMALSYRPEWAAVTFRLARILAAHPDPGERNLDEADALMKRLVDSGAIREAEVLDTAGILLAARGEWEDAAAHARAAMQAASVAGKENLIPAINQRLSLYQQNRPFELPSPGASE